MASQFGIDVRLPGRPANAPPLTFHDPQSAALYILMSYDLPLLEFVTWSLQERSLIINKPTAFSSSTWKFFLLQDQSLTQLKEQIELVAAGTAATPKPPVLQEPPAPSPTEPLLQQQQQPSASSSPLKEGDSSTPPTTAEIVDDPCRTRATTKRFTLGQPAKAVARVPVKRQQSTPPPVAARKRGSNRRIPEKENVTECPECGRKGQSIFDPSISDREGHVWQYFYCRNSMCAKGRSCNRYIGWAIRPLDR